MLDLAALLDDNRTFTALEHFSAVAKARAEGFECGGKAERVVLERVLGLLRVAVEARRWRCSIENTSDANYSRADAAESDAVCALLDHYEAAHPTLFPP